MKRALEMTMNDRLLLNQQECAAVLGVDVRVFAEDIAPDLLPVKIRTQWRWPRTEIERWIDRNKQQRAARPGS